jgi:carboxylesterase type B
MELPFVCHKVDKAVPRSVEVLISSHSGAGAALARTGNPNQPGSADWPAYETSTRWSRVLAAGL